MAESMVTVAWFDDQLGANLSITRLNEAGFRAALIDQVLAINLLSGLANGRVGLQVHSNDAQQAHALLMRDTRREGFVSATAPARRAFNVAVLGLIWQPLALCSIWTLWTLRHRFAELDANDRRLLRWAAIVNLATFTLVVVIALIV